MKNYEEKLEYLVRSQGLKCASCGEKFKVNQKIDLAHKVKAGKFNYKEYGDEVIDHVFNLAATHSNSYKKEGCNDAQNMSRAAHPVEAQLLIDKIKADIISNG